MSKTIGVNDQVSGVLNASSPPDPSYPGDIYYSEDWLLIGVEVGTPVKVAEASPDFVTWIDICDVKKPTVNINAGPGPLTFIPKKGIDYIIRASTWNKLEVGSYRLGTLSLTQEVRKMLQGKRLWTIADMDTHIDGERKYLKLLGVNGANSTFDTDYQTGLDQAILFMRIERLRLEKLIKKVNTLTKKKLG